MKPADVIISISVPVIELFHFKFQIFRVVYNYPFFSNFYLKSTSHIFVLASLLHHTLPTRNHFEKKTFILSSIKEIAGRLTDSPDHRFFGGGTLSPGRVSYEKNVEGRYLLGLSNCDSQRMVDVKINNEIVISSIYANNRRIMSRKEEGQGSENYF